MTILLACGEDSEVASLTGTVTWSTTAGDFRTAYARGAFYVNGATNADPPSNRFRTINFASAASEFWTSFRIKSGSTNQQVNSHIVRMYDAAGVCRLLVRSAGTSEIKLCTRTAAGTITDLTTSAGFSLSTTLSKYDVYVKYAGDGTGAFTFYVDGVQVATYSGANTTDGATTLSSVEFAPGYSNTGVSTAISEIIVSTTDTRGKSLALLNSTTAGNAQQWTGTASNVDQNSLTNDAQYIYTDTANEIQQYKPAALPSGNWTVNGVVMTARAIRGDTGPQNMQFATRIATTDYFSASVQPDTAFSGKQNIQETNPATATAWITSDLADTNFQYGLKSIT